MNRPSRSPPRAGTPATVPPRRSSAVGAAGAPAARRLRRRPGCRRHEQRGRRAEFTGEDYDGPALTLAYWNGFTGGDGPFMEELVKKFMSEHDNIDVKNEHRSSGPTSTSGCPRPCTAGKGPDVGVMHLDQLATNAARNVIVPVDDVAEALGLEEADFTPGGLEAGHLQGRALRHPARRALAGDVLQHRALREGRHRRGAHRRGLASTRRCKKLQGAGYADPVLDADPVAGPPDVPRRCCGRTAASRTPRTARGHLRLRGGRRRR